MMRAAPRFVGLVLTLVAVALPVRAATLVHDGVLGNSGEAGSSLARFDGPLVEAPGLAVDPHGFLWTRGGQHQLLRLAPDGRCLAVHPLPKRPGGGGTLAHADGWIVLLAGGRLHRLPADADPGTPVEDLNLVHLRALTPQPDPQGRLALATRENKILLFTPAQADKEADRAEVTFDPRDGLPDTGDVRQLVFGPDGRLFVWGARGRWSILPGQPARQPFDGGELVGGAAFVDGHWWGSAWHATLRRYDPAFRAAPGVVLGGNSGSFIGHLKGNYEIDRPTGIAPLGGRLFAVGGRFGLLHIAAWDPVAQRLDLVRRLGPLAPVPAAVALDDDGHLWTGPGAWSWDDTPDAPQQWGLAVTYVQRGLLEPLGAVTVTDRNRLFMMFPRHGKPHILRGPLDNEPQTTMDDAASLHKILDGYPVALAFFRDNKQGRVLAFGPRHTAVAVALDDNARVRDNATVDALFNDLYAPWTRVTSCAVAADGTLFVADGGQVVVLARTPEQDVAPAKDNNTAPRLAWKETARWNAWGDGDDERLGASIHLAGDAGRLWIVDSTHGRVLVFDGFDASGRAPRPPLAVHGAPDAQDPSAFDALSNPTAIAARGLRGVVVDAGNQRLVRLRLAP